MTKVLTGGARKVLFFGGLIAITLSVVLDPQFATDLARPLPEPSALSLLALAGAMGVVVSLIRRRK